MADRKRKYKRYKKSDLISKLKSHLRTRYKVPGEILDHIDFEAYLEDGMTLIEARQKLMEVYPELKKYLLKNEVVSKVEAEREDLYKLSRFLQDLVVDAEKGDKTAKEALVDLLSKALRDKNKDVIEVIKTSYEEEPVEFAKRLRNMGIISDEKFVKLTGQSPKPLTERERLIARYSFLVEDIGRELDELTQEMKKYTIEHVSKYGLKFLKAIVDKYKDDLEKKKDTLLKFKKALPEKEREIDRLLKRIDSEIKKYERLYEHAVEEHAPVDVEKLISKLSKRIEDKLTRTVEETLMRIANPTPEEELEEAIKTAELSCTCFYCGESPIVRIFENKAVCSRHALILEEEWEKHGIQPQWNPDNIAVCTQCGRETTVYRCSGGLTYCLDCSMELEGKVLFDDEVQYLGALARAEIRRSIRSLRRR